MSIEAIVAAIDVELAKKLTPAMRIKLQSSRFAWAQNLPPNLWDPGAWGGLFDGLRQKPPV